MILHMLRRHRRSGKVSCMSSPQQSPRRPAQFRTDPQSEEWRASRYTYSEAEIREINRHYGWQAFRIKPEEVTD